MSTLKELIAEGEHIHQDFKYKIDDQIKIARTLSAFANTKGGRLLIGIKDNGKIVGCDPQKELHLIEAAAKIFCQPEVKFTSKIWQEDFRLILEIDVKPSVQIIHKSKDDVGNWHPYIRIHDHTTVVNKILEWVWYEKGNPTPKPEQLAQDDLTLLKLIKQEQPVTLSKLYRKSKLPLRKVDRLVVLFICWELIEMHLERDGTYYRMRDTGNKMIDNNVF